MKNIGFYIFILFILTFASVIDAGERSPLFQGERDSNVQGVGEVTLKNSLTVEEAYKLAEKLAKIDASKKIGEFVEVIELTDSKTGLSKELVATVNSTILRYDVTRKEVRVEGDEVIAMVVIDATANPADFKASIQRYYQNEGFKKQLNDAESRISELNMEIKAQKERSIELASIKRKISESTLVNKGVIDSYKKRIKLLEHTIATGNTTLQEHVDLFTQSVAIIPQYELVIDGSSLKNKLESDLTAAEALEQDYLNTLVYIANDVLGVIVNPVERINPLTGELDVKLNITWTTLGKYSQLPFNGGVIEDGYVYRESNKNNVKITFKKLTGEPEDLVRLKYALFAKVVMNNEVFEIPVILPVESREPLKNGEECKYAEQLKTGNGELYLCFNYLFKGYDITRSSHISSFRGEYKFKKDIGIKVPSGGDLQVGMSFEIREIDSEKVVYTVAKG